MMNPYQLQLLGLTTQLSKLLKVIAHSDPSAREMKKPLYDKYKTAVDDFYESSKEEITWNLLKAQIDTLPMLDQFQVDKDAISVILSKLTKDLEEKFVSAHQLTEFTQPPPSARPPRKKRPPKAPKKPVPAPEAALLMEMAQMDERQQKASQSLQRVIDAINKVSPEFFEKKILSNFDPKDLD